MSDRRKEIRERVLALLDAADAGGPENWRDSDPGYWIGAAEGAYDAESERDAKIDRAAYDDALRRLDFAGRRAEKAERELQQAREITAEHVKAESIERLRALSAERDLATAREAIRFALGYEDWPRRQPGDGAFYWRKELRRRAASVLALAPPPVPDAAHRCGPDCAGEDHSTLPGVKP
jgi:hypothetical protein